LRKTPTRKFWATYRGPYSNRKQKLHAAALLAFIRADGMALPKGTVLGSYKVLSTLGAGGMGEVYRARDAKLGREICQSVARVVAQTGSN
jgi:serine/threonine protein kinase